MRRPSLLNINSVHLPCVITSCLSVLLFELILSSPPFSQAQTPPPITPLGLNTQVNLSSNPPPGKVQYDITGGTRPGGGANLFQSFGQFNVPTNNIANFLNNTGLPTSNILARVTGTNGNNPTLSSIYGTIQTTGFGTANLFLMNPAGFLFGPNATLNVGGMVAFTTADYLRLADNARFNAIPNVAADALLSTAHVAAYGFLGSNPGAITVQGSQFSVADRAGISLVGGNITIQSGTPGGGTAQPARLSAPNGKIQLASAASPGEFDTATLQPLPNVNGASFTSFGSVSLAPGSNINVSGANTASIRGGQFLLSVNDAVLSTANSAGQPETISLSPGSSIISSNASADPGADVQIIAGNLQMDGASIQTLNTGDGAGGNISIGGQTVSLFNGAQIVSGTSGAGVGGNITITATDTVSISGFDTTGTLSGVTTGLLVDPNSGLPLVTSGVFTTASASGNGGLIGITAPTVTLGNAATIATINTGGGLPDQKGGDVQIAAGNFQMDLASISSSTTGSGQGGGISISADTVSLTNGAQIVSATTGTGNGGGITVNATESVTISGFDPDGTLKGITTPLLLNPNTGAFAGASGIYSLTSGTATATGGTITITAPTVALDNGGMVATIASGDGAGGNIAVTNAATVTLTGGGSFISFAGQAFNTFELTGSGRGGDIAISASDTVRISGGNPDLFALSNISSQTSNPAPNSGRAGDISITAPNVILENSGTIVSSSLGTGRAGNIDVSASNQLSISGFQPEFLVDSGISTSIGGFSQGTDNGGGIHVTTPSMTLSNRGLIQTSASANGAKAGHIALDAQNLTLQNGGSIRSSGVGGASSGQIKITAPGTVTISGQYVDPNDSSLNLWSTITNTTDTGSPTGTNGGIDIHAGKLIMKDGPQIVPTEAGGQIESDTGASTGGTIRILADEFILMSSGANIINRKGSFDLGSISLTAPSITLSQSAIRGQTNIDRDAGAMTVNATAGNLTLSNDSHILTSTLQSSGNAGPIVALASNSIQLSGESTMESSGSSFATGNGGAVTLTAGNQVTLSGAGTALRSTTAGSGNGGTIAVTAGQSINLSDSATISASSTGTGNAGNISVNAGQQLMLQNSSITTQANQASGGNIDIRAVDQVRMVNSKISTSVLGGAGGGGNITIDPSTVVLQNSQILAQAVNGAGGNITITTPLFLADSTSLVSASSQFGLNGTVTIQSPTSNLSGTVASLPSSMRQQQVLQAQRCAALSGGESSTFTIAGRDTIPTEPGGWLASLLGLHSLDRGLVAETTITEQRPTMLAMAQTTEPISLRLLTPAGFLTQHFAGNGSDGCRS